MDFHISFNVAMVIAVVLGEAVSALLYSNSHVLGKRLGDRYLVTALICDVGLVIFLKYVIEQHWSVGGWQEALILSLWLSLFFVCLEGPHTVHNSLDTLSHFSGHVAHKFTLIFVMILSLVYFKRY
ncbi:uncharacterized protein LOC135471338 [Liolophura sinensis]|uniref:uncharacterized protein LOC135471338 n=1 Tax=Liolophura sinensis TaxID=3198878 RepID=UPI0031588760